jgi:hypothetical protein
MISRLCLCHDEHQYLNVKCPDVAGHRPESSYPYHERSIIKAAQEYHAEVVAGRVPILVDRHEPFVPVGRAVGPNKIGQRKVSLVKAPGVRRAGRRGGQPARPMGPGDVWPGRSRSVAGLELGTVATYARGVLSDVTSQVCTVCGAVVRVKDDGSLYLHPVSAPSAGGGARGRCEGTTGRGEGIAREVSSVVVRGSCWVAVWTDGKADGIYLDGQGRVTLAVLKAWLATPR